jgi:hypothetical protein
MARLFKLSELNPLKCHKEDCVPNVLAYLNVLERDEAFQLANVNDQILTKHVVDYLTRIYGVSHGLLEIYNTDEEPTPDMVDEILDEQNTKDILDDQLINNTVAIGLFLGKVNHFALFGKIDNEIYIIDTQTGEEISIDDPNVGLYLYKYNKINLVTTTDRKAGLKIRNASQFKKNAYMFTIKQRIRANPTSNTLKWSRYLLQHHGIIPFKKYKIIKKPNKFVRNSIFLRFEGNNAVFEDITVPTAEHFFVEMKNKSKRQTRSLTSKSTRSRSTSKKHSV